MDAIRKAYGDKVKTEACQGSGGIFDVAIDGEVVFSKFAEYRFPANKEIVELIAQRLAKRKEGAELVPHVKDMQRKLKRGRRKATSEPAPDQSVKPAPKQ